MEDIFLWLIRRFRPRVGWPQTLLALCAALCPAFVAGDSALRLPAGLFFWAGLLGLAIGMRGGRPPTTDHRPPTTDQRLGTGKLPIPNPQSPIPSPIPQYPTPVTQHPSPHHPITPSPHHPITPSPHHPSPIPHPPLRITFLVLVIALLGAALVLAADDALPPVGLVFEDAAALLRWAGAAVRQLAGAGAAPASRAWSFLAASLPRAWHDLVSAPNGGERGARLLVATSGVTLTLAGALTLGWGLTRRRPLLGWGLPLLAALALTTILGAGSGALLFVGLGALLVLAITTDFQHRAVLWERAGADFSDELKQDVAAWGAFLIVGVLVVAALVPVWLENPLANVLWRDVEAPSGLEVLERNIQLSRGGGATADIGISKLPALQLGLSLEQAPPDEVALRIRPARPLPDSPWPHYWRARIFNLYTGVGWTTNAHVSPQAPATQISAFPGTIPQQIEDARADRQIVIGLADVVAVSIPTNAERLPDGALAALTEQLPGDRYQVLSQPQEFAAPPPVSGPPPDMRGYLALPSLPPRVHELAHAIVGDRIGAYDQALALESYLRTLPYSYQVRPLPHGGDAVDQFLFEMRQGYCTYYASAMAVMARDLGIPARVASGYATGTYDPASGAYIVHEADAHAWPELYVNDRWTPFEPTPVRPLPNRVGGTGAPPAPAPPAGAEQARGNGPLVWLAVFLVVVLLSIAGLWTGRRLVPEPLVTQIQIQLERHGRRAGVPWPAGATLHEYGALLAPHLEGAAGALGEIVELVEQARYGGRELHAEEQRRLQAAGERVWAQLGRRARRP